MAQNPFSTLPVPDSAYVQAGFTLGGPIMRNKLFFFGDYVRTNDDSGRLTQGHVPEPAFRNGDFSAAPTIIYYPATGNADGSGRTHFPNNQIPANRISPIAQRPHQQDSDAEHPRCGAWREQLRDPVRPREAHEPVRHQDHLPVGAARQPIGPLQPPECRVVRPGNFRHLGRPEVRSRIRAPIRRTTRPSTTTGCGRQR